MDEFGNGIMVGIVIGVVFSVAVFLGAIFLTGRWMKKSSFRCGDAPKNS